jgi:CheY-like chemotaxis protein
VVDDDLLHRQRARRWLEPAGWRIVEATNGLEALNRLIAGGIDLVLLDLMMPEMDGFQVVSAMHNHPDWRNIPVVVLTGSDLSPSDRRRLAVGVETVLIKDEFDVAELTGEIRRAIAARTRAGAPDQATPAPAPETESETIPGQTP